MLCREIRTAQKQLLTMPPRPTPLRCGGVPCRQCHSFRVYFELLFNFGFLVFIASARNVPKDTGSRTRWHNDEIRNDPRQCTNEKNAWFSPYRVGCFIPTSKERSQRRPAAIFNSNDISRHMQKLKDDNKEEEERKERHAKGHMFSGAIHQVEHRAKEKTGIKLGEKVATQLLRSTERKGISRLAERMVERMQMIWESVTGRGVERYGERVAERGAVAGQRFLSRGERRMATGVAERAGERVTERTGQRMAERAAERGGGKFSAAARRSIGRHATELGERTGETGLVLASKGRRAAATATDRASYAAVRTTGRLTRSMARIFLIALPALGGLFAIWLLKADLRRVREVREEREDYEWAAYGTLPSKLRPCLPSTMFAGAAVADLLDAVAHFVIAYAVLIELGHSKIILKWEEISLACAIVSTVLAIAGEVADWRKMNKYRALTSDNNL